MRRYAKLLVFSFLLLLLPSFLPAQNAASFFKQAEQKFKAGKYDEAVVLYGKSLDSDSTYLNAYLRRGFLHGLMQNYDLAVLDYSAAIKLAPENGWAITSRGGAFNKLGEYEKAQVDCNRALEIDPKNQEAMNNGWAKKFLGDFDGACGDWDQSRKMGNEEAVIILKNNACP